MRKWLVLVAGLLLARNAVAGSLIVHDAWIREVPPVMNMTAGYMVVENRGDVEQALVGAQSPAFKTVEVHRSIVQDGMARMLEQDRVPVPAHGQVNFEPGGYHLMLIDPAAALRAGDEVALTLRFADGETLEVMAPVKKAMGSGHHHPHHGQ